MYFLLVQSINFTNTVSQFTGYVIDSADEKCKLYIFYLFFVQIRLVNNIDIIAFYTDYICIFYSFENYNFSRLNPLYIYTTVGNCAHGACHRY